MTTAGNYSESLTRPSILPGRSQKSTLSANLSPKIQRLAAHTASTGSSSRRLPCRNQTQISLLTYPRSCWSGARVTGRRPGNPGGVDSGGAEAILRVGQEGERRPIPVLSSIEHTSHVARGSMPDLDRRQREPPDPGARGEVRQLTHVTARAALSLPANSCCPTLSPSLMHGVSPFSRAAFRVGSWAPPHHLAARSLRTIKTAATTAH